VPGFATGGVASGRCAVPPRIRRQVFRIPLSREGPMNARNNPLLRAEFPVLTVAAQERQKPVRLGDRDVSDPARCAAALVQRGRMILDVAEVDLEAAEATFGPFHPTTWHFRNVLSEARRSWDRLRAKLGGAALEAALNEPPLTILVLGGA